MNANTEEQKPINFNRQSMIMPEAVEDLFDYRKSSTFRLGDTESDLFAGSEIQFGEELPSFGSMNNYMHKNLVHKAANN